MRTVCGVRTVSVVAAIILSAAWGMWTASTVGAQGTEPITAPDAQNPSSVPGILASAPDVYPTNYCVGCHQATDARLATATQWKGSIDREVISPCPAQTQVHAELYYTERVLVGFANAVGAAPASDALNKQVARVAAGRETYSRLLDTPVESVDAFASEAQQLRFSLNKSYTSAHAAIDAAKERRVLLFAGLTTLVLLVSLAWGFRHTQRFSSTPLARALRPRWSTLLLALVIVLFFSLPIFRTFQAEVAGSSAEELERLAAVDTAGRVADVADRAGARAWGLAKVGAHYYASDADAGEQALSEALVAIGEIRLDSLALWGEAQLVQEETLGSLPLQEQAGLAADRLEANRSRAWAANLIAGEWANVSPERAAKILETALGIAQANTTPYRDLDLRSIALTWSSLDPARARTVAVMIGDPALRAWGLRELGEATGEASLFAEATDAARAVTDPVQRARILRELAVSSGQSAIFDESWAALKGVTGAALAYSLSDLAAASGNATFAGQIEPAYPEAQAAAWLRIQKYDEAWEASTRIVDPMERARAQSAIAAAGGRADLAAGIADPTLRDRALRDLAVAAKDPVAAGAIRSPYYRVQALTALRQGVAAFSAASDLNDAYPLRSLAELLAPTDPEATLALVEAMDRESDKAVALRAVAATGDDTLFQRALGMALAARVRGDSLAPVAASLELAGVVDGARAEAALVQAYETASRIVVKYK